MVNSVLLYELINLYVADHLNIKHHLCAAVSMDEGMDAPILFVANMGKCNSDKV